MISGTDGRKAISTSALGVVLAGTLKPRRLRKQARVWPADIEELT